MAIDQCEAPDSLTDRLCSAIHRAYYHAAYSLGLLDAITVTGISR